MSIISDKDAKYIDHIYDLQEEVKELQRENVQMKHTQEQYDALVEIVGESLDNPHIALRDSVERAFKPFRKPKPARVGHLFIEAGIVNKEHTPAVELTDAVKARLGPTAGVTTVMLNSLIDSHNFQYGNTSLKTTLIRELLAGAVPPIDGDL